VASHITAASIGGPRFDPSLTPTQRSSSDNGIWLCESCAKLIDSDDSKYTIPFVTDWKVGAEQRTTREQSGIPATEFFTQAPAATHTPIPRIASLAYDVARVLLVSSGWQPSMNHWRHASSGGIQYGNGLHFWSKGYHEIRHASGTGLAMCSFGFRGVYGHRLVVVTAGEVIEEMNATAFVWLWYFEQDEGDVQHGAPTDAAR
jgi:hypothetical protein